MMFNTVRYISVACPSGKLAEKYFARGDFSLPRASASGPALISNPVRGQHLFQLSRFFSPDIVFRGTLLFQIIIKEFFKLT